ARLSRPLTGEARASAGLDKLAVRLTEASRRFPPSHHAQALPKGAKGGEASVVRTWSGWSRRWTVRAARRLKVGGPSIEYDECFRSLLLLLSHFGEGGCARPSFPALSEAPSPNA